jgi:hypothetical protein
MEAHGGITHNPGSSSNHEYRLDFFLLLLQSVLLFDGRKKDLHAGIHYQLKSGLIRVFGIDIIYRDLNFLRRVGVCIVQIVILFSADLGLLFIGLFRNQQQPCRD